MMPILQDDMCFVNIVSSSHLYDILNLLTSTAYLSCIM